MINSYENPYVGNQGVFNKTSSWNEVTIQANNSANDTPNNNIYEHATPINVNISPLLEAYKYEDADYYIFRQKITVNNAISIKVFFDHLILSNNAEMYIYSSDGKVVTGSIRNTENRLENQLWGSNTFNGMSIFIEIKIPKTELEANNIHLSKILVGKVNNSTNDLSDSASTGAFGASSYCNINVACPSGNGWGNESKSICLIETDDGFAFSGSLINNTAYDLKPYILTAWHGTNGKNPQNFTYTFLWISPTCSPTTNTNQIVLYNGANLRATYEPTDFSLLELLQSTSSNTDLYYLGWDRIGATPTSGVGIHHPGGDIMKISFADNPATIGNIRLNTNTAWRVFINRGITEKGSSGSPLFNQNHLVVGQEYSSTQSCGGVTGGTNYGRFDLSWSGGGTPSTRLQDWLDPKNCGLVTIPTINSQWQNDILLNGTSIICNSIPSLFDVTSNLTNSYIVWSITSPTNWKNIVSASQSGSQYLISPKLNAIGNITISADVLNSCLISPVTITKNITIGNTFQPIIIYNLLMLRKISI